MNILNEIKEQINFLDLEYPKRKQKLLIFLNKYHIELINNEFLFKEKKFKTINELFGYEVMVSDEICKPIVSYKGYYFNN